MKKQTTTINFGKRLAELRKVNGLTQQALGEKISTDELLGVKKQSVNFNDKFTILWR